MKKETTGYTNENSKGFSRKDFFKKAKRVVLKFGTNIITKKGTPDQDNISHLVNEVIKLIKSGKEVIIVTSGAIGCGADAILPQGITPSTIPLKQACASIGQPILMSYYNKYFEKYGYLVGQILLTDDILDRVKAYSNARNTFLTLIEKKCVPIVNENDSISIDEIKFGDNDKLAAVVSLIAGADICVLLSDIEGFYINYADEKNRTKLDIVNEITNEIKLQAGGKKSSYSTGGMATKIKAAEMLMNAGVSMAIINGTKRGTISNLFEGENEGTVFFAGKKTLSGVRRWLSHQAKPAGKVFVDEGAYTALKEKGKSLLASGISLVEKEFEGGSVIEVIFNDKVFAKGISWYSSSDLKKIMKKNSKEIEKILGNKDYDEVIHRDNLLILD